VDIQQATDNTEGDRHTNKELVSLNINKADAMVGSQQMVVYLYSLKIFKAENEVQLNRTKMSTGNEYRYDHSTALQL